MYSWKLRKKIDGFPADFTARKVSNPETKSTSRLHPPEIAAYFRQHPEAAKELLLQSSDKRFSPSTFISEEGDEYRVGWFSRTAGYECERRFANLADAAADYLLFSTGRGRWTPPGD